MKILDLECEGKEHGENMRQKVLKNLQILAPLKNEVSKIASTLKGERILCRQRLFEGEKQQN